jgi:hypothetical protein
MGSVISLLFAIKVRLAFKTGFRCRGYSQIGNINKTRHLLHVYCRRICAFCLNKI